MTNVFPNDSDYRSANREMPISCQNFRCHITNRDRHPRAFVQSARLNPEARSLSDGSRSRDSKSTQTSVSVRWCSLEASRRPRPSPRRSPPGNCRPAPASRCPLRSTRRSLACSGFSWPASRLPQESTRPSGPSTCRPVAASRCPRGSTRLPSRSSRRPAGRSILLARVMQMSRGAIANQRDASGRYARSSLLS